MIGVIGGTGFDQLPGAQVHRRHNVTSKYGPTSDVILEVEIDEKALLFLPRHASNHHIAPHLINYRANIWALHKVGVERIISVNAVGGIHPSFATGDLVLPHQLIDYTFGREFTFFDGLAGPLDHIDFSEPYSEDLRSRLLQASHVSDRNTHNFGVYACTQGPRLETAAEVQRLKRDGCDLVGMTSMPEAALARELNMEYASICMVVNPAAGLTDQALSHEEISRESKKMAADIREIILSLVSSFDEPKEEDSNLD
jgi:5'-methylthioinosine phosphorylase